MFFKWRAHTKVYYPCLTFEKEFDEEYRSLSQFFSL